MSSDQNLTAPDPDEEQPGRVRWRRFAAMLLGSVAAATVLVVLTAQGALAASFSISGLPFTITASHLHGDGFEQYATLDHMVKGSPNAGKTGGQVVVMVSAIGNADITNLCQSISLGGTNLKLTAGTDTNHVKATSMVVDSDSMSGDAEFGSIAIGQDASTLTAVPGATGAVGIFGQQARTVDIDHLRQNNYATTAASFTLPNLHLGFSSSGC
jgi:Family of unknown function (DUF6230)